MPGRERGGGGIQEMHGGDKTHIVSTLKQSMLAKQNVESKVVFVQQQTVHTEHSTKQSKQI